MNQQSPLTSEPGRKHVRRRSSTRAMLLQGAVALSALVGGVSISQLGGKPDQRTIAEALASRPVAAEAPFRRATAEPSPEQLAERFRRQGYDVTPELAQTIAAAAERHGIRREVAFGLVRTESGFSNKATSPVGAIGLAQLMPRTARWIKPGTTVRQLRDPARNVDVGFQYLRRLIDRYQGDEEMALLAYNRGPGTVDRIVKKGGNPDNGYAAAVLRDAPHNGI